MIGRLERFDIEIFRTKSSDTSTMLIEHLHRKQYKFDHNPA